MGDRDANGANINSREIIPFRFSMKLGECVSLLRVLMLRKYGYPRLLGIFQRLESILRIKSYPDAAAAVSANKRPRIQERPRSDSQRRPSFSG